MTAAPRIRLAIVHYHLRRGGVTRVIEHALTALPEDRVEAVVLTGEPPSTPGPLADRARVVPGLGYAGPDAPGDAVRLADHLEREARSALGALPDIWHIHNHALGKNPALPGAVFELARRGARLLLQVHDFAEDGRPAMYRRLRGGGEDEPLLYPVAGHVHYAVLNDRDLQFLGDAFEDDAPVHFLPNAVAAEPPKGGAGLADPSRRSEAETEARHRTGHRPCASEKRGPLGDSVPSPPRPRRFLYPTRAIRRKNLGELLLWAALARPGDRFATTLAPENPEARAVYDAWVAFAGEMDLPVDFEVGARRRFDEVVRAADVIITTSVAEGFGLAFLEPWLMERPLVGRDLPEVTTSLRREGVDLDALYEQVEVPVDWVGRERLQDRVESALGQAYTAYAALPPEGAVERAMASLVNEDRVDFGRMDEPMQREVVRRLRGDEEARSEVRPSGPGDASLHPALVEKNRRAVSRGFGLEGYGQRLMKLYDVLLKAPRSGVIDALPPQRLVSRFLAPERINLLRT